MAELMEESVVLLSWVLVLFDDVLNFHFTLFRFVSVHKGITSNVHIY